MTWMLKETRRKAITCYSYACVAKTKLDNWTGELVFNLEIIGKKLSKKTWNSCFTGLSFAKIFFAANHGEGFNSILN